MITELHERESVRVLRRAVMFTGWDLCDELGESPSVELPLCLFRPGAMQFNLYADDHDHHDACSQSTITAKTVPPGLERVIDPVPSFTPDTNRGFERVSGRTVMFANWDLRGQLGKSPSVELPYFLLHSRAMYPCANDHHDVPLHPPTTTKTTPAGLTHVNNTINPPRGTHPQTATASATTHTVPTLADTDSRATYCQRMEVIHKFLSAPLPPALHRHLDPGAEHDLGVRYPAVDETDWTLYPCRRRFHMLGY